MLLISAFEAAPLTPVVSRVSAVEHGDRVDRKTLGEDYTRFVSGDNREIARKPGNTRNTLLPEGGEVAILEGLPSSSPAIERLEGFKAGIAATQIKVVAVQPVGLDAGQGGDGVCGDAAGASRHQAGLCVQRLAAAGAYIAANRPARSARSRSSAPTGCRAPGRHPRRGARRMGGDIVYPTGAAQALDLAKQILIDCATLVPRLLPCRPA